MQMTSDSRCATDAAASFPSSVTIRRPVLTSGCSTVIDIFFLALPLRQTFLSARLCLEAQSHRRKRLRQLRPGSDRRQARVQELPDQPIYQLLHFLSLPLGQVLALVEGSPNLDVRQLVHVPHDLV